MCNIVSRLEVSVFDGFNMLAKEVIKFYLDGSWFPNFKQHLSIRNALEAIRASAQFFRF